MGKRILGIVGSYRKNGTIDALVSEILSSAETQGAITEKIYLLDKHIEFCTNCRMCTQQRGNDRGVCCHSDDMTDILDRYETADGLVIGAPVNCYNLNALTRRFMERFVCFTYWPWGQPGYKLRMKSRGKKAVLITSSAMPAPMGRIFTGAPRSPRDCGDNGCETDRLALCRTERTDDGCCRFGDHDAQGAGNRLQAGSVLI